MPLAATMSEPDTTHAPAGEPLTLVEPMLGFEELSRFRLERIPDTPFNWLHAEDDARSRFCLLSVYDSGLDPEIEISPTDAAAIGARDASEIVVLSLVVLDQDPTNIRTNLRAPLIYCPTTGKAKQVIIDNPALPVRFLLRDAASLRRAR
jgi:flagellar assembly factor FliW